MPCSTWGCDVHTRRTTPTALVAFLLTLVVPTAGVASWEWTPGLRVGGGDESDLVIDPGVTREVVEGGGFVEISPSLRVTTWPSTRQRLDLGTALSWQRYLQDGGRRLYGQSAWADFRTALADRWLLRTSLSLDAYDDSERITVRRFGAGGEIGLSFVHGRGAVELWTGGRGRSYPELEIALEDGTTEDYAEGGVSGGIDLGLRLTPELRVEARGGIQITDARDEDFDSEALFASVGAALEPVPNWRLTAFGSLQLRDFSERTELGDSDSYRQAGMGVAWNGLGAVTLELRAALAEYEWPNGTTETSHRISLAVSRDWSFGGRDRLLPDWPDEGDADGLFRLDDPGDTVELRFRAPEAQSVAVAGDFNGWDPTAHPMHRDADGWWTVELDVDPGRYEYSYVVDGEWVTPPEAAITVDDGFGGRNGVLEVVAGENGS